MSEEEEEERSDMRIDDGPWLPDVGAGAEFDVDFGYRYRLWRAWAPGDTVAFVMLNPSSADGRRLDPTLRRCVSFARRWGFGRLEVVNAFALISTDPTVLTVADDPVGPDNDRWIAHVAARSSRVVCAWSSWVEDLARLPTLLAALRPARGRTVALGYTRLGQPRHPLYLPADLEPVPYDPWAAAEGA